MNVNEVKKCCRCKQGVCHSKHILSTHLTVTRLMVDLAAVRRVDGFEQMMGGGRSGAFFAHAFGMDSEDVLKQLSPPVEVMVCDACAMSMTVAELWEIES